MAGRRVCRSGLSSWRAVDATLVGRAVAAAVAVATEQGLRLADAIPVGTGSNAIVHLRPSPIVARVMCGTVVLHPDPHAWLTREIDVGAFLAERTTSVVAPTTEIDPGPYLSGDQWMSFWEYVEVRKAPLEALDIGRALRTLHDALAEYRGPLPPRSAVLDEIDWLLNALSGDDGVSQLSAERDRLAEAILEHEHATDQQPLHGDASFSNLLATSRGPRWNDLEDVCVSARSNGTSRASCPMRGPCTAMPSALRCSRRMDANATRPRSSESIRCTRCTEPSGVGIAGAPLVAVETPSVSAQRRTGRPKATRSTNNRRRPTLPGPCGPSTIGAEGLNCSVRNGKRCFPLAMTTGISRDHALPEALQNRTAPQRYRKKKTVKPSDH